MLGSTRKISAQRSTSKARSLCSSLTAPTPTANRTRPLKSLKTAINRMPSEMTAGSVLGSFCLRRRSVTTRCRIISSYSSSHSPAYADQPEGFEGRRPFAHSVYQAESNLPGYSSPSLLLLRRIMAITDAEMTSNPNHTLAAGDDRISTMVAIVRIITNPLARVAKKPEIGLFHQCFWRFMRPSLQSKGYGVLHSDNPCQLNRSMQHPFQSIDPMMLSRRPGPLGRTQSNLNRAVSSLNHRSRMNLAIETPADRTSG